MARVVDLAADSSGSVEAAISLVVKTTVMQLRCFAASDDFITEENREIC